MGLFKNANEDPCLALLKDELSQLTVKCLEATDKTAAAKRVLQEQEAKLLEYQTKHASIKKAIDILEGHERESKAKVAA